MFAAWRAYSRFKSEHREFRKRTRAAKTARIIQLTTDMQQAAAKGDVRALFRLAAHLSTKSKKPRLPLRGPQGEIWTPQQALTCLREFYTTLYASPTNTALDTTPSYLSHVQSVTPEDALFPDFTLPEVLHSLLRLPPHKAA